VDDGIELFSGTKLDSSPPGKKRRHGQIPSRWPAGHAPRRTSLQRARRDPNTASLDLAAAGVKDAPQRPGNQSTAGNKRARRTSTAAGDCSGPVEIVHVAIEQGILAARHAAKVKRLKPIDWSLLLNVVFTDPQLATIGALASDLDKRGVKYLSASYPFNDHGKSILMEAN